MTRDDVFRDLVALIEASGRGIDTSKLALNDEAFWVHGIDSMTLVKLMGDVERKFDIEFSDADALLAYSFDRLVDLVIERSGLPIDGPQDDLPARVNFLDTLQRRAVVAGDRAVVRRRVRRQEDVVLPHEHLLRIAARLGERIPEAADQRPQVVLVAAMDPLTTLVGFLAALSVEALPLILPHPKALGGFPAYLARIDRLAEQFGNRPVVALEPGLLPDPSALGDLPVLDLPADVAGAPAAEALPPLSARRNGGDDVAFLQMTSASTGDAKLVAVTHANLCANLDGMADKLGMALGVDRTCSWMPLYHDMGLIGATLFPLYVGFTTILMRPKDFIHEPILWLRTMSEFEVTFAGAPNFAVDYAALNVDDDELEGVDLSSLRRFGLAAEPIHQATVQRWLDRFGPAGFAPEAFVPGLGMAESTLTTTTRVGKTPRYVVVETAGTVVGEPVRILGRGVCTYPAQPGPGLPDGVAGVAVFALGEAAEGLEIDLRDENGAVLTGDHVVGEICFRGTSVAGYYDPATGRAVPPADGVLHTGDLGFFDSGELFVLERMKNVIIRNGANHIASLLEQQVADVLGVLANRVLILDEDIHDPGSPIHAVVELARHLDPPTPAQRSALRSLDLPIDVVTFGRGYSLPRTTSGKKRYHVTRQLIVTGGIDAAQTVDLR